MLFPAAVVLCMWRWVTHQDMVAYRYVQGFGDKNSARLDLIFGKAKQRIGLPDENEVNPERCVGPTLREWGRH